jgi:hypothetical protein
MVVTQYIYLSLLALPFTLTFVDQFAFWPNGSTMAAIITILDHITRLLFENPYVVTIAIDFAKAFDENSAVLELPDKRRCMQLAQQLSQSMVALSDIPRRNISLPRSLSQHYPGLSS